MKNLNQYITEYIIKKKLDNPIDSEDHYEYFPKTKYELIEILNKLIKNNIYDFNCIDTSNITDMANLFYNEKFEYINIDVSNWNVSNVTNMNYMFCNCKNFNCDLSNWNVSKVTNMGSIFDRCKNFKGKGLENWDVHNVTNMRSMFYKCKKFNCNLSKWNVNKVKDMNYALDDCTSLKNKPSWYEE